MVVVDAVEEAVVVIAVVIVVVLVAVVIANHVVSAQPQLQLNDRFDFQR